MDWCIQSWAVLWYLFVVLVLVLIPKYLTSTKLFFHPSNKWCLVLHIVTVEYRLDVQYWIVHVMKLKVHHITPCPCKCTLHVYAWVVHVKSRPHVLMKVRFIELRKFVYTHKSNTVNMKRTNAWWTYFEMEWSSSALSCHVDKYISDMMTL